MAEQDQSPRSRGTGATVGFAAATLLIGAGLGVGAGYFLFDGGPDATTTDSQALAESHVEYSCAIIERLDQEDLEIENIGPLTEETLFWEVPAAAELMMAAGILDPQYEQLGEAGQEAIRNLHSLRMDELFTSAIEACGRR